MAKKKNGDFVGKYSTFYKNFFLNIADSVNELADIQKSYPNEYKKVQGFNKDPRAIESLLESLPDKEKAEILQILFRAGDFGRRFTRLIEMTEKEKRQLANDMKKFVKQMK